MIFALLSHSSILVILLFHELWYSNPHEASNKGKSDLLDRTAMRHFSVEYLRILRTAQVPSMCLSLISIYSSFSHTV